MFRTLVGAITPPGTLPDAAGANAVLAVHPLQLSRWLEEVWSKGGIGGAAWTTILGGAAASPFGDMSKTRVPDALLSTLLSGVKPVATAPTPQQPYSGAAGIGLTPPPIWEHLLYAYLIESTGIFEILGEVARRYVAGETLPAPTFDTMAWVRSTEDLFFRDSPLFSTGGPLVSQLRPDTTVNRRNAYWRMFGLDLPHPAPRHIVGQSWKQDAGPTANVRFLELWHELLRQIWLGFENDTNSSGAKATDDSYIGYICQTLGEMLQLRRQGGMLAREEFGYVTMLSWFHLTVEYDTALVLDLSANAGARGNPADRLAAIGTRVGMAPSRQARELFELADLVSPLMWAIELGLFNTPSTAQILYKHTNLAPGTSPAVANTMNRVIDLWQSATGERIKDLAVTTRRPVADRRSAQPTRLLPGSLVPTVAPPSNGHRTPAART
ncbi:MAG TPA: hypothetical protein VGB75_11455 [Jatrophihabitans sp.]|jgi:hypothetical protein|uniref:hypothetical protein n=1 Tax=Jatrophihabitans sp. TaxID=1932789 RepID=UPI002EE23CDA